MIINQTVSGGGGMNWETVSVSASDLTQDDLGFYGLIYAGMDAIKFVRTGMYNTANEEFVLAYPWNSSQNKPITEVNHTMVELELASTTIDGNVLYFFFYDAGMEGATIGDVRLS